MNYSNLGEVLALPKEELLEHADEIALSCCKFLATYFPDALVRRAFLKRIGVIFADDSSFANVGFTVIPNSPDNVHVHIGKNVSIAPNVTCICDSCANNGNALNQYTYVKNKLTKKASIVIEDEAWIGANATILPGVTISPFTVIGAGAVVTKSTEAYGIYAGIPAKKIGDVRSWDNGSI